MKIPSFPHCGAEMLLFIIVGTKFMIIMFKLANVRVNTVEKSLQLDPSDSPLPSLGVKMRAVFQNQ